MNISQTKPLLSAENVSVIRDGNAILKDVTINIREHDFITIIGPNGAGKSVLLKALMGFFPVDSGKIAKREGITIGYVPQRFVADQTIPINVRRFLTLNKKADKEAVDKVIAETGIEAIVDKQLFILSGGEMQRVLLARALLSSPDVLVLDEPAQNLDVTGQLAFYKLLEKVYEERKLSILMVSHDLHLVMSSTRKVVCLFHHVCCSGEPQAVTKDPEFISLFGDDMAKMMAVYQHSHDHDHDHVHEEGVCDG